MPLNTVTITWDETDPRLTGVAGTITFILSTVLTDTTGGLDVHPIPKTYFFTAGTGQSDPLVANDNSSALPAGSWYTITVQPQGGPADTFQAFINFADGATQALASLVPITQLPTMLAYLPLPAGGPPSAGEIPVAIGDGTQDTAWGAGGAGGGGVASVTAADTSVVIGGTPTNPTARTGTLDVIAADHPPAAAWSNNSKKITSLANGSAAQDAAAFGQIPTSAAAIGGLLAASNLSDLASAGTARTNLGLGSAATQPSSAFDAAGAAAAAAAASVPLAGGTMTGGLAPAVAALTFGASIAVNAALGNAFAVTLTSSAGTLANPTNPVDGQTIRVRVIQDTTGGRTLAYGTAYDFGAAGAPTLSTGASKVDILGFEYVASLSKWCYLGSGLGF